jgi:uncharacterized Tic20 family protein
MSDPNTPPPSDDSSPEETPEETPPQMDQPSSSEETPPPVSDPTPAAEPSQAEPSQAEPSQAEPSQAEPSQAAPSESSIPLEAPPTAGVALGQGTLAEGDEKTMGLLAHLLGGITCIVGPLIIWLIKKDESPFVNDQGKEALNFQITILIGYVAATIIAMIPIVQCIVALLYPALAIVSLIFGVLGGLEANKGVVYRYPFAARFVS